MTRTTAELRAIYAPACTSKLRTGWNEAYRALDAVMKKWRYAPKSGQTGSYNCRHITGGSNYSLHAYEADFIFTFWTGVRVTAAEAVDINWNTNPYGRVLHTDMPRGMVDEIVAIRTNSGDQVWRWGGYYSGNKDAMHFEIVASPAELATGIKGTPSQEVAELTPAEMKELKDHITQSAKDAVAAILAEHGVRYDPELTTLKILTEQKSDDTGFEDGIKAVRRDIKDAVAAILQSNPNG